MELDKEDMYVPVVKWSTVLLLLLLALQYRLKTASIDFKNAFVQPKLPEPLHMEFPHG